MEDPRQLAIRCEYRATGYSDDEIALLHDELSEIASSQFRPQGIPEAGASFDIGIVVQWLGIAAAGGIVGNAAYDLLKKLGRKLADFYKRKEKASGFPPDIYCLDLRFDDFDLRIHGGEPQEGPDCNFLRYETLAHLPAIVQLVTERVSEAPLSSTQPQAIDIYEPRITQNEGGDIDLLFDFPWRIEGLVKCFYWSYFPARNSLEDGYPETEPNG